VADSVPEGKKLLAETTLTQLKAKKEQIAELDIAIADKVEGDHEFEEEITNADTYHMTLEERLAYLTVYSQGWPAIALQNGTKQ